jgi:hypothetical protein
MIKNAIACLDNKSDYSPFPTTSLKSEIRRISKYLNPLNEILRAVRFREKLKRKELYK